MHDAWQYLRMSPAEFYRTTPRELAILFRAQQQRRYDEYEQMAQGAIMGEIAARNKRPKVTDLFERPTGKEESVETKVARLEENTRDTNDWLARLTSGGAGASGKE